MKHTHNAKLHKPWAWVPTLYFSSGLPYVAVMSIAVIMYKRLGLSNTDIALYTSWLYLPWVIKPLWSPFVDLVKSKRFWVICMQSLIAASFAGIAFTLPTPFFVQSSLAFFWLMAFSSATFDISADGFYMLALDTSKQSFFVGIRNTCYRLAMIFGQGILVMLAGLMEEGKLFPSLQGNIALAWSMAFYLLAALFIGLTLWHAVALPKPAEDAHRARLSPAQLLKEFMGTFVSFFKKEKIGLVFFFILTYRLGEAQLGKIASPFLLDGAAEGGLALGTAQVGLVYGTVGVIALLLGGILGGMAVARGGLRKWILWMALAMNVPDLLYVVLAYVRPQNFFYVVSSVALEQLGYGFGFTAFTLYLIHVARGPFKTAHYAIGTGFMALGMMLPGMLAGKMQELLGYAPFFIYVCLCTLPGLLATWWVRKTLPTHPTQE